MMEGEQTPTQESAVAPVAPAAPAEPFAHLPADLRAPWTALDLLIFIIFAFGSLLVLNQFLAVAAVTLLGVPPERLLEFAMTNAPFVAIRQTLWFAILLLFLFAMIRIRFETPFWRTIGWQALRLGQMTPLRTALLLLLGGMVFAIAVQFAAQFVAPRTKLPIEVFFQSRQSVLVMMAMGILVAPLVEETIFRGFLYPVLARGMGVRGGVLATGMLFGLMHVPQLWGGWGHIALLTTVGIIFTWVRARTGTVTASYLMHLSYNTLLFLGFFFATGGLRYFPGS